MSGRRGRIEARFGGSADLYAASEQAAGPDLDRMVAVAAPAGGERVLDVATGPGHTARRFAPLVAQIVACDLAAGMVVKARELLRAAGIANASFAVADAERLPFAAGSFDLVTCRIAPHHFLDLDASAREVARVLRTNGLAVIVDSMSPDGDAAGVFLHEAEVLRDPTHVRSPRRTEWVALYERAGMRVDHVEVVRKRHPFEPWLDRGGVSPRLRAELRARFLAAPPKAVADLEIETVDDRVEAFTDSKILLAARRARARGSGRAPTRAR